MLTELVQLQEDDTSQIARGWLFFGGKGSNSCSWEGKLSGYVRIFPYFTVKQAKFPRTLAGILTNWANVQGPALLFTWPGLASYSEYYYSVYC